MTSTNPGERHTAGLSLSVGRASIAVRLFLALTWLTAAALCLAGGVVIARGAAPLAVLLILPIGWIGVIAAAYVFAPHSRFGVWLDRFLPRLRGPRIALYVALALWLASIAFLAIV